MTAKTPARAPRRAGTAAAPDTVRGPGAAAPQTPARVPHSTLGSARPQATSMSERQLEVAVKGILRDVQALVPAGDVLGYHTYFSKASNAGFPDWVFAGPGGILYRELKTAKGHLSVAQIMWKRALKAAGADVDVWRPADLESGRVARELVALAGMRVAS